MFPRMLLVVMLVGAAWSVPAMAAYDGNQLYKACTQAALRGICLGYTNLKNGVILYNRADREDHMGNVG